MSSRYVFTIKYKNVYIYVLIYVCVYVTRLIEELVKCDNLSGKKIEQVLRLNVTRHCLGGGEVNLRVGKESYLCVVA